jgi:hypothetical protein
MRMRQYSQRIRIPPHLHHPQLHMQRRRLLQIRIRHMQKMSTQDMTRMRSMMLLQPGQQLRQRQRRYPHILATAR